MGLSHGRILCHTATRAKRVEQKKHWYLLGFNGPIYTKEKTILWLPFCHMLQTFSTYSKKQSKVQHALAHKHHGDTSSPQHKGQFVSALFYTDMSSSVWLFLITLGSLNWALKMEFTPFFFCIPTAVPPPCLFQFDYFLLATWLIWSLSCQSLFSPGLSRHFTFSTTDLKPRAEMRRDRRNRKRGSRKKSSNPLRTLLFHDWSVLYSNSKEATENCFHLTWSKELHQNEKSHMIAEITMPFLNLLRPPHAWIIAETLENWIHSTLFFKE